VTWTDWLTLAAVTCCVLMFVLGIRRGRSRVAAQIAAAQADARAAAVAELQAMLSNSVTVVAGNTMDSGASPLPLSTGAIDDGSRSLHPSRQPRILLDGVPSDLRLPVGGHTALDQVVTGDRSVHPDHVRRGGGSVVAGLHSRQGVSPGEDRLMTAGDCREGCALFTDSTCADAGECRIRAVVRGGR
jgi:hypothetical protein